LSIQVEQRTSSDIAVPTLLKPNRAEAERILGQPISSTERALRVAELLVSECDLSAAIITLDRDGMVLLSKGIQEIISAIPKSVYDITGAGDMVLAMLGLCMASGVDLSEAAHIANIAAGLEVECFGISAVSRAEVSKRLLPDVSRSLSKILGLDDMIHLAGEYHRQGKTIVFTNGCFDLLHIGHVTCLEDAAKLGDVLIVATNSDDSVRRLKGPTRPVVRDVDRARMLAALECVKHVVIFDEDTPSSLISRVLPDVLAKGGTTDVIVGREIVESNGGKVWSLPAVAGISTTRLIGSIQHVCHVQEK
jgi:D-beta-D-heptose 7-phosphate kinase/D-beta-D-heptose 1-phosphate adenosyltransferase